MMKRFVTVAALMTGASLFCLPTQAQTGTSGQSTINSGGAAPSGSVGTTSNTPREGGSSTTMGAGGTMTGPGTTNQGTMSGQSGTMGTHGTMTHQGTMTNQGTMSNQATTGTSANMGGQTGARAGGGMNYEAQATGGTRRMRGDAAERQVTECLNNAMAQRQPLESCRR